MKKIVLMVMILAVCLSFDDEAKAATKKSVNLTNEYNWTCIHRPDVLRLRVIDSNDGDIIREMTWVDTWEDEDTNVQLNSLKLATVLFCDGDVVELTNVDKNITVRETINFHELRMSMFNN